MTEGSAARQPARPRFTRGYSWLVTYALVDLTRWRARYRLLRGYLWLVGLGLLGQGVLTLVFLAARVDAWQVTHGVFNRDGRHGALHVVWGLVILLALRVGRSERSLLALGFGFGTFYFGFGVLGILVYHPFGFWLEAGENGFHLIVGGMSILTSTYAWLGRRAPVAPAARAPSARE